LNRVSLYLSPQKGGEEQRYDFLIFTERVHAQELA
jgi:hypothetical protein